MLPETSSAGLLHRLLGSERPELKLVFVLVTLFLLAVLAYPLYALLHLAFIGDIGTGLTLELIHKELTAPGFVTAFVNSFKVSGTVALLATVLGFFSAYGLSFCALRAGTRHVIELILLLPLFLPSITYGFAVIYSFGRQGLITRTLGQLPFSIYGFAGLVMAGVIYTLPPVFLIMQNAFAYVDKNFVTVSRVMGDNICRRFYQTALRPVAGAAASAFILAFFLNFTDFGIPASIAGRYEVIATRLYAVMMGAVPDFHSGSVIALSMLLPSVLAVLILRRCGRLNFRYSKISRQQPAPAALRDWSFLLFYAVLSLWLLCVFAVIFIVPFVQSWPYQAWFTLDTIRRVFAENALLDTYLNSLYVAVLSAGCGTVLCYLSGMVNARSHLPAWCKAVTDIFAMVTNTVPGMVLGVGMLFAFSGTPLANTFAILVIANTVHFFTTPYLMAQQAFSRMNAGFETTAALMGDTWFQTLRRVVIPNTLGTLVQMFAYIFVNSMVTISAVVFLAGAYTQVMTSKIKELQYFEKFDAIFTLSVLIFLTNAAVKLLIDGCGAWQRHRRLQLSRAQEAADLQDKACQS